MKYLKSFLDILLILIKTFPKLFADLFGFVPYIGIWIKYLPEFIGLTKSIIEMTKKGITELQIKSDLKKIENAFKETNRENAARNINDIFRN